jgi:hypothetical protein
MAGCTKAAEGRCPKCPGNHGREDPRE